MNAGKDVKTRYASDSHVTTRGIVLPGSVRSFDKILRVPWAV